MGYESFRRFASKTPLGLFGQQGAPIGVDFGVASMKALQLVAGDPPSLGAAACVPVPDDLQADHARRLSFQLEELPRIVRNSGFKGARVVCSMPAGQSLCRHLQVVRPSDGKLDALVQSTVAAQIGADAGALVFRHVEVGTVAGTNKVEVIVTAAPRTLVERVVGALRGSKLDVVGVHAEFHAVMRAFELVMQRTDDDADATLFVDLGAASTKVAVAHGRSVAFARTIGFGGRAVDDCLARRFGCSAADARRRRTACAVPAGVGAGSEEAGAPAGVDGSDLAEPVGILADEIRMCLRYHETSTGGRRVGRAVFVGGECRDRALCRGIARELGLPAQVGDPLAQLKRTGREPSPGVDMGRPQPGWAVVLGLCLSPTDL